MYNNFSISIVVSNYNGLEYLRRSIPILLALDHSDYEILVIDNCSTDDSVEYLKTQSRIRILTSNVKGGKNFGLNTGILESRGEYILFLDNDVLLTDRKILHKVINSFKTLSKVGFLTLSLINEGEDVVRFYGSYLSYLTFIKRNRRISQDDIGLIDKSLVVGVQGASFFCKKNIFNVIGNFDTVFPFGGEDVDIGIKSIAFGFNNYVYSQSLCVHIGMQERMDNKRYLAKIVNNDVGLLSTIIKRYSIFNLLISLSLFIPYQLVKSLKDSFLRRDVRFIYAYFFTLVKISRHYKELLSIRKGFQKTRVRRGDTFLAINQPKI